MEQVHDPPEVEPGIGLVEDDPPDGTQPRHNRGHDPAQRMADHDDVLTGAGGIEGVGHQPGVAHGRG